MKLVLRMLAVVLTTLALVAPATAADASTPKKGGTYVSRTDDVVKVKANGKKIKKLFIMQGLSQCSPVPFKTGPVKPAIKKGRFTWTGGLTNMIGSTTAFTIKGRFTGQGGKTLKVTAIDAACHTPKRKYTFTLR